MKKISSIQLQQEGWISFELSDKEIFLSQKEVDELVLDTYKWVLKLNVKKLKDNDVYMKRVNDAHERRKNNA